MKAIILVGGQGTRLRPLTSHKPKPLLPIANIAFLYRQLHWLQSYGVNDVTMSLGYLPDAFEEHFSDHPFPDMKISYVVEEEPLGTAGAIKFAAKEMSDDFIVCNGDILTSMDLKGLIDFHKKNNSPATISLTYVQDPSAFGVVPTHPDGQVIAFVEKPPKESAPSHWINAGTYILKPEFLDLIPEDIQVSVERETFPTLLRTGKMYAQESDSYWLDIGTPEKYIKAHKDMLDNIAEDKMLSNIVELQKNIYGYEDCVIGSDVIASEATLLGKGSQIGNGVKLQKASVGDNCIIEDGSELINSVLHDNVRIEQNCVIKESVISGGSHLGKNSELSDFTLIGTNEKIESNTVLRSAKVPHEV